MRPEESGLDICKTDPEDMPLCVHAAGVTRQTDDRICVSEARDATALKHFHKCKPAFSEMHK